MSRQNYDLLENLESVTGTRLSYDELGIAATDGGDSIDKVGEETYDPARPQEFDPGTYREEHGEVAVEGGDERHDFFNSATVREGTEGKEAIGLDENAFKSIGDTSRIFSVLRHPIKAIKARYTEEVAGRQYYDIDQGKRDLMVGTGTALLGASAYLFNESDTETLGYLAFDGSELEELEVYEEFDYSLEDIDEKLEEGDILEFRLEEGKTNYEIHNNF